MDYRIGQYLRFTRRPVLSPVCAMEMRLTSDATSQIAIRRIDILVALDVVMMFPGRNPPCGASISRLGKPWVNWTLAGDQSGASNIITFSNLQ